MKNGANEVVPVVDGRLETAVEGVGSGVRYLIFGSIITVDHTVTRDRDGSTVSKPNVTLNQLISVAPRTITVTVTLAGEMFTKEFPDGEGVVRYLWTDYKGWGITPVSAN